MLVFILKCIINLIDKVRLRNLLKFLKIGRKILIHIYITYKLICI